MLLFKLEKNGKDMQKVIESNSIYELMNFDAKLSR